LPGRVSTDERPAIVDARDRIGDWEIDTTIGKRHQGALLSLVERKSKFTLIIKLSKKQADLVVEAATDLLTPYEETVCTITADSGKEFTYHESIKEQVHTTMYFAHPYHAWERGLCENTNGLIRQYFPKGMSFEAITGEQVQVAMNRLNTRPRKTLEYKTPNEVFFQTVMTQTACRYLLHLLFEFTFKKKYGFS
jgi:IS30 family transposase